MDINSWDYKIVKLKNLDQTFQNSNCNPKAPTTTAIKKCLLRHLANAAGVTTPLPLQTPIKV